jgi:hypothetical protein
MKQDESLVCLARLAIATLLRVRGKFPEFQFSADRLDRQRLGLVLIPSGLQVAQNSFGNTKECSPLCLFVKWMTIRSTGLNRIDRMIKRYAAGSRFKRQHVEMRRAAEAY